MKHIKYFSNIHLQSDITLFDIANGFDCKTDIVEVTEKTSSGLSIHSSFPVHNSEETVGIQEQIMTFFY